MSTDVTEPDIATESDVDTEAPRRRSPILLAFLVVCVLAVAAGGVLGGMIWRQHSVEVARQDALDAGNKAAVVLLSYDHRDLYRSMDQRIDLLTGDFRDRYRAMVQDTVAPAAAAKQVVTTASVVASSIVEAAADHVKLLVFVNQSSASPSLSEPLLTGSRVEISLDETDGRWLVSDLKPV